MAAVQLRPAISSFMNGFPPSTGYCWSRSQEQPIDAFIESYDPHAKPVASTKAKVHQNASNHVSPIDDFGY
jgi:hypothetical protein